MRAITKRIESNQNSLECHREVAEERELIVKTRNNVRINSLKIKISNKMKEKYKENLRSKKLEAEESAKNLDSIRESCQKKLNKFLNKKKAIIYLKRSDKKRKRRKWR